MINWDKISVTKLFGLKFSKPCFVLMSLNDIKFGYIIAAWIMS